MGRLDDITLEELYDPKDQIDEGKPRKRVLAAIGRKQGDQLDTLADRMVLSRKRFATGSIGSRKNRSSRHLTMLLDQEV